MTTATALAYTGPDFGPIETAFHVLSQNWVCALLDEPARMAFVEPAESLEARASGARVFGPASEMRWRRDAATWHCLAVIDDNSRQIDGFSQAGTLTRLPENELWRLWGERKSGSWQDGRMPRSLRYPGVDADRVALEIALYKVAQEPLPSIVRYCRLIPEPEDN